MNEISPIGGSFRDPAGHVYECDDRILRSVTSRGAANYQAALDRGLYEALISQGYLLPQEEVPPPKGSERQSDVELWLEHPRLDAITYPYEWSFPQLQTAAIFHLDLLLFCLERGFTLSDTSAYNVQFRRGKPIFIDHLSFRPYRDGEFWAGHRQFCNEFLNPLLLRAVLGVPHNAWYRGCISGIKAGELNALLPPHTKLFPTVLFHVYLLARMERRQGLGRGKGSKKINSLPRHQYRAIIQSLRGSVAKLKPKQRGNRLWEAYEESNSYSRTAEEEKERFVAEAVKDAGAVRVLDIGCNRGHYASVCLNAGAEFVLGLEQDDATVEAAYARASKENLNFLPIRFDAADPSPASGWQHRERPPLEMRCRFDLTLALAVIHHLVIANNLPFDDVVGWLTRWAPLGILEFVPKEDPMVRQLLSTREDIFMDYSENKLIERLQCRAEILKEQTLDNGRKLFLYRRN